MRKIKNYLRQISYLLLDKHTFVANVTRFMLRLINESWSNREIIPVHWMDLYSESENIVLGDKVFSFSCGPHYFDHSVSDTEDVVIPPVCYRVFHNCIISPHSSSVVISNKKIIIERSGREDQRYFNYSGGYIQWHGKRNAIVNCHNISSRIDKGIHLGGNGSWNYYHWTVEIVTKFLYLDSLPVEYSSYPLLVGEDAMRIHSFSEMLSKLNKNREIVWLKTDKNYTVDELLYIDSPNSLPFNLRGKKRFMIKDFLIRKESIDFLRNRLLLPLTISKKWGENCPRKVFLVRKKDRREYNQDEIESFLNKLGFVSLDMEGLHLERQIEIFNNADWIAGPTGAAWTNLIFAHKGLKGVCWMAEEYGDFSAFSNLASIVGVDLRYLTFSIGVDSTEALYNAHYKLNINLLTNAIESYGANQIS